jgi:superfamily II DNA/RNA helicase
MNVLEVHKRIVADYEQYIRSFINIADPAIEQVVRGELEKGKLWPEPLLQFNPGYRKSGAVADLVREGALHRDLADIFAGYSLYRHQLEAIRLGVAGRDFVVTSGNRQDAALQAGHFNDFVQVVRLRAGIHKALRDAPGGVLTYARLGEAVFRALSLPFADFSKLEKEPDLAPVRRRYEGTFQNFLVYRALADLRRSWRIVLPNLEQCALLAIDYVDLDETAAAEGFWKGTPLVNAMTVAQRREFLCTILDFFRLEYALHSENFLEHSRMKENERDFREQLRAPWTLDEREDLRPPTVARLDPLARSAHLASVSVGPASSLGKYIKQMAKEYGFDREDFGGQRYRDFILALLDRLAEADYLQRLKARSEAGDEVDAYRLKVDKILWRLGDSRTIKSDVIKQRSFRSKVQRPNAFFASMYAREFANTKRLVAADHTGQLDAETRLDREDRFKCDWWLDATKRARDEARIRSQAVSALFCSPTMELGVDIGGLSVVHLRNAPPNSANYAQRAGRAGRSGQGALVFTYCSSFSPHDRHYFQHQAEMVAGEVQPPRIDLFNRDLLQSHLHAMAISEVGLPGLESQNGRAASLMSLVDPNGRDLPLSDTTRAGLRLGPAAFASVLAAFARAIHDFAHELPRRGAGWFSDSWSQTALEKLPDQLDRALGRWRKLHQSARTSLSRATQRIESGTLAASSDEYKKLVRLQNQATRQLNLLVNDLGKRTSDLSEFYPYRYLASEGFLPGYNFTRLPLRIFVPTGTSAGEYISRPRAVALREFGPLNIIYHNGRKYRVDQLVVQDAEEALTEAKLSLKAGYFLSGDQVDLEICPFTGLNLSDNANKEPLVDLLEMSESRATEVDRISCEEEERASRGFEIETYFSVDGSLDRIRAAVVKVADSPLLNLRYIPADTPFPRREAFEWSYSLGERYASLFDEILDFARKLVAPDPKAPGRRKRVQYWTALALLRGVMSSPAAGVQMLTTRLDKLGAANPGADEPETAENPVADSEELATADTAPTQLVETGDWSEHQRRQLRDFATRLGALSGQEHDAKLTNLVAVIEDWLDAGINPVVFCRYIPTANYIGEQIKPLLSRKYGKLDVQVVTSEDPDEVRRDRIAGMAPAALRVLVATDCLSEGINLQELFTGVLHYDLPWNPNRLEQREGRVDRFGQSATVVKACLLYGEDNPIDGIVLDVLLRKVREIKRATGINVPFPEDSQSIIDTITQALLLNPDRKISRRKEKEATLFDFSDFGEAAEAKRNVTRKVDEAAEREKASRSIFAQNAIQASEIEQDLKAVDEAIGDPRAVEDFVTSVLQGVLGVQVIKDRTEAGYTIVTGNLPPQLQGILPDGPTARVSFVSPPPKGFRYIGRNHRFVEQLCQIVMANTLSRQGKRAARAAVVRTREVGVKTTLMLFRCRNVIEQARDATRHPHQIVAEEMLIWGWRPAKGGREYLGHEEAKALLMRTRPSSDLSPQSRANFLHAELEQTVSLGQEFDRVAEQQSKRLVEAHERFSALMDKHRYQVVYPVLPMDLLGVYVLLPEVAS